MTAGRTIDLRQRWRRSRALPGPDRKGAVLHLSMRPDLVGVWAHRVGAWVRAANWDHVFPVESVLALAERMEKAGLRGRVRQIGVVAHGNDAGLVQLSPPLTASSVASPELAAQLRRLGEYLVSEGTLTFYSCIAGQGRRGSELLTALSRALPDRTIIGFEVFGFIGAENTLNQAGMMKAVDTPVAQFAIDAKAPQLGYLSPWSPYAKWARNGQITRVPRFERNDLAQRKGGSPPGGVCAKPTCPGHQSLDDRCPGW